MPWIEWPLLYIGPMRDDCRAFGHFFPCAAQVDERLGYDHERIVAHFRDTRIVRIQFVQMPERRAVEQRSRLPFARIARRDDPLAVGRADRHVERLGDAIPRRGFLDHADHALERGQRGLLQAVGQRETKHQFGVGRAFQRREQRGVDLHRQVAAQLVEIADQPIVREQPAAVAERMAVGFLHGRIGRRADMRDEHARVDRAGRFAQIAVVPGGMHGAVAERQFIGMAVPADPEAVAVGRRHAEFRMQALVDQRMLRAKQHGLERDRIAGVGEPAAHGALLRDELSRMVAEFAAAGPLDWPPRSSGDDSAATRRARQSPSASITRAE